MILKVLEEKFYTNYSAGYLISGKKMVGYPADLVSGATLVNINIDYGARVCSHLTSDHGSE